MQDIHTHIGQFNDIYYDYHDVFLALRENGISETTLAYLTPKFEDSNIASEFYYAVVEELKLAKKYADEISLKINILHWSDPLLFDAGITLNQIFSEYEYKGIAIHPVLHEWTTIHADKLTAIFDLLNEKKLPIFIHTGVSECDEPMQFCKWIEAYPNVKVHLAHCKDSEKIIEIFSKYSNTFGDTAFCPKTNYEAICNAGFKERMFFGTDFPITHYWEAYKSGVKKVNKDILSENYQKLLNKI